MRGKGACPAGVCGVVRTSCLEREKQLRGRLAGRGEVGVGDKGREAGLDPGRGRSCPQPAAWGQKTLKTSGA